MSTEPIDVLGSDADLGAALGVHAAPEGTRIHFVPDATSDLARTLGLTAGTATREPVAVDVMELDDGGVAVNMVVVGVPPDRRGWWRRRPRCSVEVDGRSAWGGPATTVLIANGEYLRGHDVVPRGHPGDGRLEVHVHTLRGRQRRRMQARLTTGAHLPHPGIRTAQGTRVTVRVDRPTPLEVDGVERAATRAVTVRVAPGAMVLVP